MTGILERCSNGANATIHHVRRCNDVSAGVSMRHSLARQHRYRFVVQYIASIVNDAVLAVGGVRVQGKVGNDSEIRESGLDLPHAHAAPSLQDSRIRRHPVTFCLRR